MPERYESYLLRTTRELERFQPLWKALWREDQNATPFQSPEWLLPWWHLFGEHDHRVIVISRQGKPISFLPFYIHHNHTLQEHQLLLIGAGTSDYLDGVFSPDCGPEQIWMTFDALKSEGGWDVLYANQLRRQSMLFKALSQANGWEVQGFSGEPCSRMPAAPIENLPVKIRRNAMYYRNRAMRLGALELVVADARNCLDAFNTLVRLHTNRWQSCGEPGVLADSRVLACHREAIPLLEREGMLRLYSLLLNGEVLGVAYALVDPADRPERTLYVYLTAYSVERADLRPGTILLALLTEHAYREGITTIDMLRGNEGYKKLWHVQSQPTFGFAYRSAAQEWRLLSA
jgi:CelD/BcsL family acetyltransferase involved in cellulose biosynthesis